jgi:hypothetical protein
VREPIGLDVVQGPADAARARTGELVLAETLPIQRGLADCSVLLAVVLARQGDCVCVAELLGNA